MNINLMISLLMILMHDTYTKDAQEVEPCPKWKLDNLLRTSNSDKPAPVYVLMLKGLPEFDDRREYNILSNIPFIGASKNRGKIRDNNYLILKHREGKHRSKGKPNFRPPKPPGLPKTTRRPKTTTSLELPEMTFEFRVTVKKEGNEAEPNSKENVGS